MPPEKLENRSYSSLAGLRRPAGPGRGRDGPLFRTLLGGVRREAKRVVPASVGYRPSLPRRGWRI